MKVICPYVFEEEIQKHKDDFWMYDVYYEKDVGKIGSDLMFQKMWNKFPKQDIFILHADMSPMYDNWLEDVFTYVDKYPNAGMIGCMLLYPAKNEEGNYYIQHAGGMFNENNSPDHYGSGLVLENSSKFKETLEVDKGQYDYVRKVPWTTFGGVYIRREVINKVGNFSPLYEWTYNRDVDYCLRTREAGWDIINVPVKLFHHESRDNKRLKTADKLKAEMRNLETLKKLWANTEWYKNINE